jgi:hypothetical protein
MAHLWRSTTQGVSGLQVIYTVSGATCQRDSCCHPDVLSCMFVQKHPSTLVHLPLLNSHGTANDSCYEHGCCAGIASRVLCMPAGQKLRWKGPLCLLTLYTS